MRDIMASQELASLEGAYTQGIYKKHQRREHCNLPRPKKPYKYLGLFLYKSKQPKEIH